MSEFTPVASKAELDLLDEGEMVEGYMLGFGGGAEPGNDHSRSFWHGWRNGASDGKHRETDEAQYRLAREIVARHMKAH